MEITRREDRERYVLDKMAGTLGRREGRHLTDAVHCNVRAVAYARGLAQGEKRHFDRGSLIRMVTGIGLGWVLETGEMAQMETISADDDTIGTIDVWMRDHPVEIKVTWRSSRGDLASCDDWLTQLGGYAARNIPEGRQTMRGEMWVVHLGGDQGKKFCKEHGVPETVMRRKHPDTDRPRLICPVDGCWEFLDDGDRDPDVRCHEITWTRAELESLHAILTWRLATLKEQMENMTYQPGNPPPILWGYPYECKGCAVAESWGCPGMGSKDLEETLEGSILALSAKGA